MRIIIDCFKQVKGEGKSMGIYNFTLDLVKILNQGKKKLSDSRVKDAEIVVIANKYNRNEFKEKGIKVVLIKNYDPLDKFQCVTWELFGVANVRKKLKGDIVILPRGYASLLQPEYDVIVIHDLIPFYYNENYPGVFNRVENTYVMKRLRSSAKHCRKIITISEKSKEDIVSRFGISEEKISVIYNGQKPLHFEKKDGDLKPYAVAVTSALPHKNAGGIVRSFQKYCEISENPVDLIVIGIGDVDAYELPDSIKEKITCYRFIQDEQEMYSIIANAKIFVFLSLVEGFGRPPIEAMQLEVPVICSNVSSLPEVVGNAAALVDPQNPEEVALEMDELVNDERKRQDLVEKGLENVKRFSWERLSALYWEVILK